MPSLDRFPGEPALQGGHALERVRDADPGLVAFHDLAGRPRGTGFVADRHGTVITSHETVDGLPRLVLHGADGRYGIVAADAVTPLPALGLALVRGGDLGVAPCRSPPGDRPHRRLCPDPRRGLARGAGARHGLRDVHRHRPHPPGARCPGAGRRHRRAGRAAARRGAAGGPVLDPATGTVVGVLGTALRTDVSDVGFAVPCVRRPPPSPRCSWRTRPPSPPTGPTSTSPDWSG